MFYPICIPTLASAPGATEQAHKPNALVELAELKVCEGFLRQRGPSLVCSAQPMPKDKR